MKRSNSPLLLTYPIQKSLFFVAVNGYAYLLIASLNDEKLLFLTGNFASCYLGFGEDVIDLTVSSSIKDITINRNYMLPLFSNCFS